MGTIIFLIVLIIIIGYFFSNHPLTVFIILLLSAICITVYIVSNKIKREKQEAEYRKKREEEHRKERERAHEAEKQAKKYSELLIPKVGILNMNKDYLTDRSLEKHKDYTVFDIETTGLSAEYDYIIEISAIRVRDNEIADTFTSLIKPPKSIPQSASAINHITDLTVSNAPRTEQVMSKFIEFIGNDILVGHNIERFDIPFIKRFAYFGNDYADTLKLAKSIDTGTADRKLQTLCDHYGIVNEQAHRSLSDCKAEFELYTKLWEQKNIDEHRFTTSLVCGTKLAQSNIALCHIGDTLRYEYNYNKNKYELFSNNGFVGYISPSKELDFKVNRSSIDSITVFAVSNIANNKKSMMISVNLTNKVKRCFKENIDLISNKTSCQQSLSNAVLGSEVIIKKSDSNKYVFYIKQDTPTEIGYAPKRFEEILNQIFSNDYWAVISKIELNNNNNLTATISIEYGK